MASLLISPGMRPYLPTWGEMWLVAAALFVFFKALTWARRSDRFANVSAMRTAGYFLGWPGMDPDAFCGRRAAAVPNARQWALALAKIGLGATTLWIVVPKLPAERPALIGAVGFAGLILLVHFGIFELLALAWRSAGFGVSSIMQAPFRANSLADFWSRRWNIAYRDLSLELCFRPAARRFGAPAGTLLAFMISGVLHELVISFPAGAGFGGPTIYFLLQGTGLLIERTAFACRILRRRPLLGRLFTFAFVIGPLGWLFHRAFLTAVILPFLAAIGAR